jgi:hypothetical protein
MITEFVVEQLHSTPMQLCKKKQHASGAMATKKRSVFKKESGIYIIRLVQRVSTEC